MTTARPIERLLRQFVAIPELGIAMAVVLLAIIFDCVNPTLLSWDSVATMLGAMPFVGIIAVGETFLMIAGELDLSVGKVAGMCAIIAGCLMRDHHWSMAMGVGAGLMIGAAVGLVNGLLAVWARIPAFIVTLGMFYVADGINKLVSGGDVIYPLPASLTEIGRAIPFDWPWLISWAFLALVAVACAGQFMLSRTVWGRMVCATGGNREVARIAGIRVGAVKVACYVLTSVLAALAGILQMAEHESGDSEIGTGWELKVIATVVIGGVSLFGGAGTVIGTMLGLALLAIVVGGLNVSGIGPNWQTVTFGVILVAAVGMDVLRRRTKRA